MMHVINLTGAIKVAIKKEPLVSEAYSLLLNAVQLGNFQITITDTQGNVSFAICLYSTFTNVLTFYFYVINIQGNTDYCHQPFSYKTVLPYTAIELELEFQLIETRI